MDRKEFIKMCGLLGIGLPVLPAYNALLKNTRIKSTDKVIVIGAGAAGLSAAYLLNQQGIIVEVKTGKLVG